MKLNELIQPKSTKAVFTFGRFNPPTKGHAHLLNMVKNGAKGADHYVYTGRTQDPKRNPLSYEDKITMMRAMYPTINIVDDPNVKNPWQALEELGKHYKEVTLVVGSDRKQDFESQMRPYMKEFGIDKFTVVSSGERDADATDVQGVSATKARAFARAGDFGSFSQTVDGGETLKKELYTKVRKGMGVTESKKPKMPKDPEIKKRDPNWRDMEALRKSGAAGSHKDKKALDKRGYQKHKGKSYDINESIKEKSLAPVTQSKPKIDIINNIASRKDGKPFPLSYKDTGGASTGGLFYITPQVAKRFINFFDRASKDNQNFIIDALKSISKTAQVFKHLGLQYNMKLSTTEAPVNKQSKPIVYVDMDGVLANFFAEWAKLAGVTTGNYKDIPPAKVDPTLDKMVGTDFFNRLPKFPTADKLLQMVTAMYGSYSILSSPLRGDHENSKAQKIKWIQRELAIQPDNIIVVGRKDSYAVQKDGTPNILIDDRGRNIQGWRDRGGFGVKYQADEDPLSKVEQALTQFKGQYNLTEWGGRVVKGINTTPDVGVNQIPIEAKKMGFKVSKDGVPPIMQPKNMRTVKRMKEALIKINGSNKELTLQQQIDLLEITKGIRKVIQEKKAKRIKKGAVNPSEVPYQNDPGTMSLLTHPGTAMNQKMRATAKPGTDEWFKTWRTLSYLTKGKKNHYMLPIKEQLEKLLIKHGVIKENAPAQDVQQSLNNIKQDLENKDLDINTSNKIANYLKALAKKVAVAYTNITGQQPPQTEDAEQISMASVEQMQQMIAHMCKVDMNKCGQFLVQNKIVASIDQAENYIKNILPQNVKKDVDMIHKAGKDAGAGEVSDWFAGLDDDIMRLASKASGNRVIQREITNRFKGSFTTEVLVKKNITKESLTKFLQDAEDGKVIDMQSLVSVDAGNIEKYVGAEYRAVFDAIKADVFPYSPPGTGHNMGPGEVALTMFGNPIVKGEVGDLNVGGVLYELKGAKTRNPSGKSSKSGGRMNGKDVSKPTTGRSAIKQWITKNLGDNALKPYLSGTKLLELNWNAKGIQNINKLIADNIQNANNRDTKMKDFMLTLWKTMIQNHTAIKDFDTRVQSMVTNGQLNDTAVKVIVELLYESYADSDGQKDASGKQTPFNIMVFNAQSLEYKIIRATEGFTQQGIKVIGGIDWNDANASASPQLYID